jgi:eukaryotic-like serine/threonine-protein kinase
MNEVIFIMFILLIIALAVLLFLLVRYSQGKIAGVCNIGVIGDYTLLCQIGIGGMACIYLAEHNIHKYQVAIKILENSLWNDAQIVEKFLAEGRNIRKINNKYPNSPVVKVFDYRRDETTGKYIIIMEYLPGKNLKDIIYSRSRIDLVFKLYIIKEIARALRDCHQLDIYHSDVSPDNIIVNESTVTLIDFGISREKSARHRAEREAITGKYNYMPPEQCDGGRITGKSDIYSLGATLFHLVEGRPPYISKNYSDIIEMHKLCAIPQIQSPAPEELKKLIYRMLDKNPDYRPDAQQVIDRLQYLINLDI